MRAHVNRKCYFLLLASIFLTPRNFGIFFSKAGLLTSFQLQTPSHFTLLLGENSGLLCLKCIKELTAAGQLEIFTHIPF